jgi:hypothetical protein
MSKQNNPKPNEQNQGGQESIKEGRNIPLPNPNQGQGSGQGNGSGQTTTTEKDRK